MHYDYIIIGSGLAGLNFALNASKKGTVLIITKGKLFEGSTQLAQGGIAAVFGSGDSFKKHIKDTLEAGAFHNDRKTVEYIVKKAPAAIRRLHKLGVKFDGWRKGRPALNLEGGHSKNRIVHCGDHTGKSIEETLEKKVRSNRKIKIMENTAAKDLLVKNNICYGIRVIVRKNIRDIYGGFVILATGGIGQVYKRTTNPSIATGDGISMASRAGCRLADLEFVQFHPTALKRGLDPYFLISETMRGHGAVIIDGKGKRLMAGRHPRADLAPRDIISRVLFEEEKRAPVFLDATEIGKADFLRKFPSIRKKLRDCGLDPSRDLIPITAVAHYSCGGVATDIKGRTTVKRLYAFGETACTGLHGANRLASNSLLEALILTEAIPSPIKSYDRPEFKTPLFKRQKSTARARKLIREIMWEKVGIIRTRSGLKKALKQLSSLQKKLSSPTDRESTITTNLLKTAILITASALKRKKSLGCHYMTGR